ncbi:GntR family transcriptional regulator [Acidothermaceae bacterium B102]|nr:GntR family transcriptional regulator [Acidothermaceae bacterium B102]
MLPGSSKDRRIAPQALASAIRDRVIRGQYPPGHRLTEDDLAEQYGVSRIPVREALRLLEGEGFVRVIPYTGTFVAELTAQDAADLLEIRGVLEPLAAARAAETRTNVHLDGLREILSEGYTALAKEDLELLAELNTRFHTVLTEASGNVTLNQIIGTLRHKITWVYSVELPRRAADSWAEHRLIINALERGDADSARALMVAHVRSAQAAYRLRPALPGAS